MLIILLQVLVSQKEERESTERADTNQRAWGYERGRKRVKTTAQTGGQTRPERGRGDANKGGETQTRARRCEQGWGDANKGRRHERGWGDVNKGGDDANEAQTRCHLL